jgi:hypothetical protein
MGMFDHVSYQAKCSCCGQEITRWQTKDGPCLLMTLEPSEVRNFYATCPSCYTWNEYNVEILTYNVKPAEKPRFQLTS